jgi:hypothetical protein
MPVQLSRSGTSHPRLWGRSVSLPYHQRPTPIATYRAVTATVIYRIASTCRALVCEFPKLQPSRTKGDDIVGRGGHHGD